MLGANSGWMIWVRVQIRDTIELILFPGLAIFLPWTWCFAIFRHLAKLPMLYRADTANALKVAQHMGWVDDPKYWAQQRRLVTLVDHSDHYLARTRSSKWMARHVQVTGHWPSPQEPALLCTFHWGAGMWSLRHARQSGIKAHSLVAPMTKSNFKGRPVLYGYVKARVKTVSNELGVDALDVSSSMRPVLKALRAKEQVLAAVDVPADAVDASVEADMLGTKMRMPRGLLRVAADHGIAVTLFTVGLDLSTGQRHLRLVTLPVDTNAESLTRSVFAHLDHAIRAEPWAWHFWAQTSRFLSNPKQYDDDQMVA